MVLAEGQLFVLRGKRHKVEVDMKIEVEYAGKYLAAWVVDQMRLRAIVRRPYAVIDGIARPLTDVIYHCPEAMK